MVNKLNIPSQRNPKQIQDPYAKTKLKSEELVKNFFKGKIDM